MHSETGKTGTATDNIVATMLSLAILAECAVGRSRPVRALVFLLLQHAEAVAREFVASQTILPAPAALPLVGGEGGPADLYGLAERFRWLAAALQAVMGRASWQGFGDSFGGPGLRSTVDTPSRPGALGRAAVRFVMGCTKPPDDTS